MTPTIRDYENKAIRIVRYGEKESIYYCLNDVVEALANSARPADYLKKIRKHYPEIAQGWGQIVTPLSIQTSGGKQKTNFTDKDGIIRIFQSISTTKIEYFKQWVEDIESELFTSNTDTQLSDIKDLKGEMVLYQPNETVRLEVKLQDDTVWLTQAQIIDLFESSKANISEHITNIYDQGELDYEATVRNFRTVQIEGDRKVRTLFSTNFETV